MLKRDGEPAPAPRPRPRPRTASFRSPPRNGHGHARPSAARFLVPALVAAAVAVALGAYGSVHDPAGTAFNLAGFNSTGAVPVAVHCLYALGYQTYETRVMWHSLVGCFFFGAFSAKMLLLRAERLPGWLLPIAGGLTFAALTVIWLTSALWFFRTFGVTT
ncbi:DUF6529 family protein [Streptomyces sp. A3M-1-3]|uniref:DUF6529 family protein n=1 Tax=Streptomyces sp. A3M-1-3 TaxID=2962044 RepID=UPI0035ABCC25